MPVYHILNVTLKWSHVWTMCSCTLYGKENTHYRRWSVCFLSCGQPIMSERWTFWGPLKRQDSHVHATRVHTMASHEDADSLEARWTQQERWEAKTFIIGFDMFCHHLSAYCSSGFGGDDEAGGTSDERTTPHYMWHTKVGRRRSAHTHAHTHTHN